MLLLAPPARAQDREGAAIRSARSCPRSSSPALAAGVVVLEPDLGTAVCYVMLCAVLLWLAGARGALLPRSARWRSLPLLAALAALGRLPARPPPLVPAPRGGSARRGLPGDPVADRRRRRRLVRQRPRRQPAEALLPPVSRTPTSSSRSSARSSASSARVAVVACFAVVALARAARGAPRARRLRRFPRRRRDRDDRRAGGDQPVASCSRSCRPRESRCRSSPTAARRSSPPGSPAGLILNVSQHEVERAEA